MKPRSDTTPRSYWLQHDALKLPAPHHGVLTGPEKTQVAIIGGGITGLLSGLLLLRAGKTVTLLDANQIGANSHSVRSTGHLTEILDRDFTELVRRFGVDAMIRFTEAHRMAIHRLGSLIEELEGAGACGWARLPGYLYCEQEHQVDDLRAQASLLDQLHIPCALVKHVPLPFSVAQAIRIENQAQVNPLALIRLLERTFSKEGGRIYEHSLVKSVRPTTRGVRVITNHGSLIAEHALITTHTPVLTGSVVPFQLTPARTYVLAARVRNAPIMDGLFWDWSDPGHYLRVSEGELLAGGEDHRTGSQNTIETESLNRLKDYVRSRFELEQISSSWSGQVLESIDGLPLVGPSIRSERILYATGFGGNGISQGAMAAILMSEQVQGRKEDLMTLLSPHRLIRPMHLMRWISQNRVYPMNLLRSRILQPLANALQNQGSLAVDSLARDEAQVGTLGGRDIAAYRDANGILHAVSSRCTHLGGELHFNEFEKTWDCNCHGSRFSIDGEVLEGPAKTALERISLPQKSPPPETKEKKQEAPDKDTKKAA
jgi:glycine/D-amino acid oxidase-like deaminating enzyme/nitrite reductase/ring-hydroxylating ferredoxin subunit